MILPTPCRIFTTSLQPPKITQFGPPSAASPNRRCGDPAVVKRKNGAFRAATGHAEPSVVKGSAVQFEEIGARVDQRGQPVRTSDQANAALVRSRDRVAAVEELEVVATDQPRDEYRVPATYVLGPH